MLGLTNESGKDNMNDAGNRGQLQADKAASAQIIEGSALSMPRVYSSFNDNNTVDAAVCSSEQFSQSNYGFL